MEYMVITTSYKGSYIRIWLGTLHVKGLFQASEFYIFDPSYLKELNKTNQVSNHE